MERNRYDQIEIPGHFRWEVNKLELNEMARTRIQTVATVGAGQAGLSFQNVFFVQCIIGTLCCANQTFATIFVNVQSERGNEFKILNDPFKIINIHCENGHKVFFFEKYRLYPIPLAHPTY